MIIIRIKGGLGNQLFQYAVGRAVALHHKVPLKLDLTIFETYNCITVIGWISLAYRQK